MFALTGAVDDTSHDGDGHFFDTVVLFAPFRHLLTQMALDFFSQTLEIITTGAAAARASDDCRREGAQPQALQNFLRDDDFLAAITTGLRSQRNANGIANTLLQQHRQRCCGSDNALAPHARFGETQMQCVVRLRRQIGVDVNQILYPAHFAGQDDPVLFQADFFRARGAGQCGFDQCIVCDFRQFFRGFRAGVFVQFPGQQFLVERPPIDADADWFFMAAGELNHLAELQITLFSTADVAGVDAVFRQRLGTGWMLFQQLVAIEVKIPN